MTSDEPSSLAWAVSSRLAPLYCGALGDGHFAMRAPRSFERHAVISMILAKPIEAFIRSGVVKTGTITPEGREIIYDVRKDGDVVGELCALDTPRRDRAVAIEATGAIVIGFEEVVSTLAGDALLLTTFIAALCGVLADAYAQLNHVVRGDVSHGLVAVLKTLARKLGRPSGSLVEIDAYLTQEELAQMVVARRERVSTALNILRRDGIVSYSANGNLLDYDRMLVDNSFRDKF